MLNIYFILKMLFYVKKFKPQKYQTTGYCCFKKNKTTDCYIWNDEISILVKFTHILLTTLTLQDSQQLIYIYSIFILFYSIIYIIVVEQCL